MRVAVGIIEKDGKFLLCQRRPNKKLPLKWEFPGGKFEENETSKEALKREIKEELGVKINNSKLLMNVKHEYDFGLADIDFYYCAVLNYDFILTEHDNFGWFNLDEIKKLDYVESIDKIINLLK